MEYVRNATCRTCGTKIPLAIKRDHLDMPVCAGCVSVNYEKMGCGKVWDSADDDLAARYLRIVETFHRRKEC